MNFLHSIRSNHTHYDRYGSDNAKTRSFKWDRSEIVVIIPKSPLKISLMEHIQFRFNPFFFQFETHSKLITVYYEIA